MPDLGGRVPARPGVDLGSHFGAALADLLGFAAALKPRAPAPGVRVLGGLRGLPALLAPDPALGTARSGRRSVDFGTELTFPEQFVIRLDRE